MTVGVNIFDLRSTPLPVSRYDIKTLGVDGGVHIRVSPDNPRLTLVELFNRQGINLPRVHERKIENIFFREDFRRTYADEVGKLEFPGRVLEPYTEAFFNHVDAKAIAASRLSVVVDYAYSRLSMFLPGIFGRLGCDMVALNAYSDHSRAPKTPENRAAHLEKLSETVSMLKANVGVLVESDGERLALVDERGRVVEDNTLLAAVSWLALQDALERPVHGEGGSVGRGKGGGKDGSENGSPMIAVTIAATGAVDRIAAESGVKIVRTRQDARSLMEFASRAGQDILFDGDSEGGPSSLGSSRPSMPCFRWRRSLNSSPGTR